MAKRAAQEPSLEELQKRGWMQKATACAVFGLGTKTLDREIRPKLPEGSERICERKVLISGPALYQYLLRKHGDVDVDMVGGVNQASPALERFRAAQAAKAELQLGTMRGTLVPVEQVHRVFGAIATVLRQASELLLRRHGEEAREIMADALETASQKLEDLRMDGTPDLDDGDDDGDATA